MANFADLAAEREQLDTARAIAAARRQEPGLPRPCGVCHNCGEAIEAAAFCDSDCRDDWQLRRRAGK